MTVSRLKLTTARRAVQIIFLVLVGVFTYLLFLKPTAVCWLCPFFHLQLPFAGSGFAAASVFPGLGWNPPEISGWWIIGGFVLLLLLLGRAFCGWVCPLGTFLEHIEKLSPFSKKIKAKVKTARAFKYSKYAVFVVSLVLAFELGEAVFCRFCPAGAVFKGMTGFLYIPAVAILAVVTLAVFVFGMRVWCAYLCPLAAFGGLFSKAQAWGIGVDKESCDSCGKCEKLCPMEVSIVAQYVQIGRELKDADCTKCFECVEACPKGALRFP